MSEDDDFTDEIQLYGAIGVGGALLAFNMSRPPLTPSTVVVPVVAAGVWYLFTPLVACMMSGKGFLVCTAKGVGETVADAAGEAVGAVVNAVGTGSHDLGDAIVNKGLGGLQRPAPPPTASAQERYDWTVQGLSAKCGLTAGLTFGISELASLAADERSFCMQLADITKIEATEEERTMFGPMIQAEVWDCRYNRNCPPLIDAYKQKLKEQMIAHTAAQGEVQGYTLKFDSGGREWLDYTDPKKQDVQVFRDGIGNIVSLGAYTPYVTDNHASTPTQYSAGDAATNATATQQATNAYNSGTSSIGWNTA